MPITFHEELLNDAAAFAGAAEILEKITAAIAEQKKENKLGFVKLPFAEEGYQEVLSLAQEVGGECEDVVVIGVGGTDLGARAVHRALHHQYYNLQAELRHNRPRLFFVGDTTDPVAVQEVIDVLNWPKLLIVMISKSGNTIEQMTTFLLLRDRLIREVGEVQSKRQIITITDPENGTLREITKREGYRSLAVPSDVGGRFAVLSCIGLFPLALTGIDIAKLREGAAAMDANPTSAARFALHQYLAYQGGKPISVLMPYTYSLREVGSWFRQLWAESLGKRVNRQNEVVEIGPTPIAALGPVDQHSQIQLFREGPNDKIITFITVASAATDFSLPESYPDLPHVRYLAGHHMNEILHAEQQATASALAEAGRPSGTLELDRLDAFTLGELLYFLELATVYAAECFNVNAYDQPGVERGKELMHKLLGD